MPRACLIHVTANLQVKNIPDKLRQSLQRYAREHKRTLSKVVFTAIERELSRGEYFASGPTGLSSILESDIGHGCSHAENV
jgi:hypothetical protein